MVDDTNVTYIVNGEIYSHLDHREELEKKYKFKGHSDCEIVGPLYKEHGPDKFWHYLDGMWGVVLFDKTSGKYYVGRDHIGIIPVYWGIGKDGAVFVSSEMKAIYD
jgi:asparagine synthase (glutamine-hydrolysing)